MNLEKRVEDQKEKKEKELEKMIKEENEKKMKEELDKMHKDVPEIPPLPKPEKKVNQSAKPNHSPNPQSNVFDPKLIYGAREESLELFNFPQWAMIAAPNDAGIDLWSSHQVIGFIRMNSIWRYASIHNGQISYVGKLGSYENEYFFRSKSKCDRAVKTLNGKIANEISKMIAESEVALSDAEQSAVIAHE